MFKRRPSKRTTLQDRLTAWAKKVREQAETVKPGAQKEALLQKASRAEMAAEVDDWINSSGLCPPNVIEVGGLINEAKRRAAKEKAKRRA